MTEQEIYQRALEKFGIDAQIGQLHEEIGELMVAISKAIRYVNKYNEKSEVLNGNIMSEIADVEIMLEQMKIVFNKEKLWDFENIKKGKLHKLKNYLTETK